MATPRGAKHRDLEQRLRDLESNLRTVTNLVLRREQLAVDEGDFVVSGGGNVVLLDGGGVIVKDGGLMRWYDSAGVIRANLATQTSEQTGNELTTLAMWPADSNGYDSAQIGTIEDLANGIVRQGVLVEDGSGQDNLWVMAGTWAGKLVLTPSDGDELDLRDAGGSLRATLGPVTWGGVDDGYGLYLSRDNGDDVFYVSESVFRWADRSQLTLDVRLEGGNTFIAGGSYGTDGYNVSLRLQGANNAREVHVRDGANSAHVPIVASSFDTPSARELKHDDGQLDTALAKLRATPIRRWRYQAESRSSTGGDPQPAPQQLGPMAEDAPAELVKGTGEDARVSLTSSVGMVWRGVQELADENDRLRDQLAALSARVDALEAGHTS